MSSFSIPSHKRAALLGAAAFLSLAAFAGVATILDSGSTAHAAIGTTPAAVPVAVETVKPEKVNLWHSFSGRLEPVDHAEIRPEVGGRITEVRIHDGQAVRAGDILFVIEPKPYEAAVTRAKANLAAAVTRAGFAKTQFGRAENMIRSQAISQQIFDQRKNDTRVADAAVEAARAELKQADIDLDHAFVKAPISGRVSRAEVTVGNLVQTGPGAPVLTSIVSDDGIYADFDVDEQTYIQSVRALKSAGANEQAIPVELSVGGDDGHPYKGTVYSFDNQINIGTGTIRARARFANEDGVLVPGMFVAVKLGSATNQTALVIPDRAIGTDQDKKFVLIAGADNKVAYREVTLGDAPEIGRRVVASGLKVGDRVIVDGLQHVRPDTVVTAEEAGRDGSIPEHLASN